MNRENHPSFPEPPWRRFKVRTIVLTSILITFGLAFLTGIISGIVQAIAEVDFTQSVLFFPIFVILLYTVVGIWAHSKCKRLGINLEQIIGHLPANYQELPLLGLVGAMLLFSLSMFWISFYPLSYISPAVLEKILTEKIFDYGYPIARSGFYNFLIFVMTAIVAPVIEEFIFRGIILHRWAAKWGIKPAIVLSSVFFGSLHPNVLGLSVFGLIMALLYIKTRTLLVPIAAHILNNAGAILLELISKFFDSAETVATVEQFRERWWIGVVYLMLSAPWLVHFISKNWPRTNAIMPYPANLSFENN